MNESQSDEQINGMRIRSDDSKYDDRCSNLLYRITTYWRNYRFLEIRFGNLRVWRGVEIWEILEIWGSGEVLKLEMLEIWPSKRLISSRVEI